MLEFHSLDRFAYRWTERPHRLGSMSAFALDKEDTPRSGLVFASAKSEEGREPAIDAKEFARVRRDWLSPQLSEIREAEARLMISPGEWPDESEMTVHGRTWRVPDAGVDRLRLPPIVVSSHGYRYIEPIGSKKRPTPAPLEHGVSIPWDYIRTSTNTDKQQWNDRAGDAGVWLRGFFVRSMAWKTAKGITKQKKQWRLQGTHIGRLAAEVTGVRANQDGLELDLMAGLQGRQAAPGDTGQEWEGHDSYALVLLYDLLLPSEGRATQHDARLHNDKDKGDTGRLRASLGLPHAHGRMDVLSGFDIDIIAQPPSGATKAHKSWANASVGRLIRGLEIGIDEGHGVVGFSNKGEINYPHTVRARVSASSVPVGGIEQSQWRIGPPDRGHGANNESLVSWVVGSRSEVG